MAWPGKLISTSIETWSLPIDTCLIRVFVYIFASALAAHPIGKKTQTCHLSIGSDHLFMYCTKYFHNAQSLLPRHKCCVECCNIFGVWTKLSTMAIVSYQLLILYLSLVIVQNFFFVIKFTKFVTLVLSMIVMPLFNADLVLQGYFFQFSILGKCFIYTLNKKVSQS